MSLRGWVQHHANSLNLFALLRRMGVRKQTATRIATIWQRRVHPLIY